MTLHPSESALFLVVTISCHGFNGLNLYTHLENIDLIIDLFDGDLRFHNLWFLFLVDHTDSGFKAANSLLIVQFGKCNWLLHVDLT